MTSVSSAVYTITVSGITGHGTLGLNLIDDHSIRDLAGNPLTTAGYPVSFSNQTTVSTGLNPGQVVSADLNSDGKMDLVVVNSNNNTVSIVLGHGDGTYASQRTYSVGANPTAVSVGDLNGDGKNDIFNNYWPAPHGTNKPGYYITWEFEKSAFTKPNIIQGLTGARKLMFNDYYGNGKLGLLIASSGVDALPFPGDSVQIVSFGTDLSMTIKNITEVLGYYHSGSSGDVDNDGDIDLLMYSGGSQTKMGPVYFENIGNGNFKYNADLITGLGYDFGNANNYYCMELFDINKDGYLDLILGGDNKSRASRVIWGTATHKFNANNQSILPAKTSFSSVMDMAYTDMDKDGDIDIILLH